MAAHAMLKHDREKVTVREEQNTLEREVNVNKDLAQYKARGTNAYANRIA